MRIVVQGTNPATSATPTIPIKVSGILVTDTDFTSSIKFLASGTIEGETTGNFQPKVGGAAGSEPADLGMTMQAKVGPSFGSFGNLAWRDTGYDFSSPLSMPIFGGNFATNGATLSIVRGNSDYALSSFESGTINLATPLAGDATFDLIVDGGDYTIWADNFNPVGSGYQFYQGDFSGDGVVDGGDYTIWADNYLQTQAPYLSGSNAAGLASISTVGLNYKLSLPIQTTIYWLINEGFDSSTSDDTYLDLKVAGTLIAMTPLPAQGSAIPEPSTLALAGIGVLASLARSLRVLAPRFFPRLRRCSAACFCDPS